MGSAEEIVETKKVIEQDNTGLVYVGHIPHGFYEEEMKKYFQQFGKLTHIKVCRSRKSGNSKGYGFVEFKNQEVAQIVAETMNNYVFFKRRLIVEYIPPEKRPKGLFRSKTKKPMHVPVRCREAKEKYTKNRVKDDKTVLKKTKKGLEKLQAKVKRLASLGVQCDIKPTGVSEELLAEFGFKEVQAPSVKKEKLKQKKSNLRIKKGK